MEPTPPEIPKRSPSPPSLPPSQPPAQTAPSPAHTGTKTVLAVVIGLIVAAVLGVIGLVAFVAFIMLSASDLEISDEIRAAVLTVEDAEKWFEIETKENLEEWDAERYFDGSAQVYYFYNDEEESIYINCNLTYEPGRTDGFVSTAGNPSVVSKWLMNVTSRENRGHCFTYFTSSSKLQL